MMHPLDDKYWSKREHWRWWCYQCPDDPRTIVSKRPRWAHNFRFILIKLLLMHLICIEGNAHCHAAPE
jgi:hypothetical protein